MASWKTGQGLRLTGLALFCRTGGDDDPKSVLLIGQFHWRHLIQKKAPGDSGRNEFGDLGVDDAGLGKAQGGLNVGAGECHWQ